MGPQISMLLTVSLPSTNRAQRRLTSVFTYLCVERKRVKSHWTNERDVRGLGVEDVVLGRDPEPGVLREHLHHFESLEVVNENVWKP